MEEKIKGIRKRPQTWVALVGLVLGILFLVMGTVLPAQKSKETSGEVYTVQYYTEALETRIAALCTSVSGIQEATVLLTLENGSEYVYARNGDNQSSGDASWDYMILAGGEGEEAVLMTEIYPKVRGVAVVCTGGDSPTVQQTVTELLSASLGIASHRIKVAGM